MKRAFLGYALAFAFLTVCTAAFGQTQLPYLDGDGPDPAGTACPGESRAASVTLTSPRISISTASRATFHANHPQSFRMGIFSVDVRRDGKVAVLIPASADIDPELRRTLAAYGRTVTIDQPIPGCAHLATVFALAFDPDSGIIVGTDLGKPPGTGGPLHGRPLDDVPASTSSTPAPNFVFIDGPLPSGGPTMCPGERTLHQITYPGRFTVPVGSAEAFVAQNGRHAGSIAGTIRNDGGVAIVFPSAEHVDFRLRDSLVIAARQIRLADPLPGCLRLAGVFMGTFNVDDGSLELREVPLTMPILSASPSPTSQ